MPVKETNHGARLLGTDKFCTSQLYSGNPACSVDVDCMPPDPQPAGSACCWLKSHSDRPHRSITLTLVWMEITHPSHIFSFSQNFCRNCTCPPACASGRFGGEDTAAGESSPRGGGAGRNYRCQWPP